MKKRDLLIFRIVTGLFSLMMLGGAITYFVNYEMVAETFTSLGVTPSLIYPLAIAKILGIAAIWLIKNPLIKNLAYLGFGIDLVAAIVAHINAGDGDAFGPVVPLILVTVSYVYYRRLQGKA